MVHRRKNNLAAKRSRDARRSKEDEIAIRAALLEQENLQLKWEMARLRTETGRLRELLLAEDTEEAAGELSLEI
jgi:bZIP factor